MIYKFDKIAYNSTVKKKPTDADRSNYIGLENIDPDSLFVENYGSDITPKGEKLIMKKGDVLFGKRRAYQKKVAIAPCDGIFSAHGMVLRPKEDVIDKDFFPFFIHSDQFLNEAVRISVGGLSPTINWRDLKELEFSLPPLSIQRELSKKLWAAYRLKESYKKLLLATRDMVKSQFIEMFDCYADRVALSSLCDTFIDGNWIEAKDQSDTGIRLIQTGNVGVGTFKDKDDKARYISEETFNRLNCTEVVEGDILISRLPDPVGRACIIPAGLGKSITAVDCTIIRLNDKVLPKFFVAFTNTPDYAMQIKKVLSGTTRLRVSRANLGKIQVPLPTIDKQQQFVTIAEQADKSEFELKKSIEAIDAVIKSLINN
jgi:type I restriction enzyme S subunit